MTKNEAINWLINITADIGKMQHQDLWHYGQALSEIREMLEESADVVEVVRCWKCIWWDDCPSSTIAPNLHKCKRVGRMSMPSDGFCSFGERKGGEQNG